METNGREIIVRPNGAETVRQEFSGNEQRRSAELASIAVAARERALIEARYLMAERHPRNYEDVRVRILKHCERPGFAEVARYRKPVGKKNVNGEWVQQYAEGLSARFAEIARQEMGNTETHSAMVYEDDFIRIVRAWVVDLERNSTESREITIAKAVEKRGKLDRKTGQWSAPEDREVISQRLNSYNEPVFLVKATEDEIRNKQNAEISKTHRDCALRLLPKDIRDDAESQCKSTMNDPKKVDPNAAKRKMIDAFARIGVLPSDLSTYIGHSIDNLVPAELDDLRGLYTAISDGETTFNEALKARYDTSAAEAGEESPQDHDARLQRQTREQEAEARRREQEEKAAATAPPRDRDLTDEENRELDRQLAAEDEAGSKKTQSRSKFGGLGGRK